MTKSGYIEKCIPRPLLATAMDMCNLNLFAGYGAMSVVQDGGKRNRLRNCVDPETRGAEGQTGPPL